MNMTKLAREKRKREHLELSKKDNLSPQEEKRLRKLEEQRKADHHYAYQCSRVK